MPLADHPVDEMREKEKGSRARSNEEWQPVMLQSKRSKLATTTGTRSKITTTKVPLFLSSHLRILQALYETNHRGVALDRNDWEESSQDSNNKSHDVVDETVWEMIASFLEQRSNMNHQKLNAEHTNGIYQEYLKFWKKEEDLQGGSNGVAGSIPIRGPVVSLANDLNLQATTTTPSPPLSRQHHPLHHRQHGSSFEAPTGTTAAGFFRESVFLNNDVPCNRSINLLTCLLRRKSNLEQQKAHQKNALFLPLRQEVQMRTETLQQIIRDQQGLQVKHERAVALQLLTSPERFRLGNEWINKSPSTFSAASPAKMEEILEDISVMETKLRLWERLSSDLSALDSATT